MKKRLKKKEKEKRHARTVDNESFLTVFWLASGQHAKKKSEMRLFVTFLVRGAEVEKLRL